MAKSLKTTTQRAHDLFIVFNSLTPADIAKHAGADTMKNVRNVTKLVDELEESVRGYIELLSQLNSAVEKVRTKWQEKFKKADKEDEAKLLKEANDEAKAVLEEQTKKLKIKEAQEKEVEVKIVSDDRHALLKELVSKVGPEKWVSTKALAETWMAIEEAKEI